MTYKTVPNMSMMYSFYNNEKICIWLCCLDFLSATPRIVSKAKSVEVDNKSTLSAVSLNILEPITRIQIWLANGERTVQRFNVSHRVSHIKDFNEKYQGSQRSPPFALSTALPFLRFLDETLTLEEADLKNAVIIQRLQKTAKPFRKLW